MREITMKDARVTAASEPVTMHLRIPWEDVSFLAKLALAPERAC